MPVYPLPSTRVSNLLVQDRLLGQLQDDQLAILKIQDQLSSGRRINLPSEDSPAAARAIALQRNIELKEQVQTNLQTGQSFLTATDTALSGVAELLNDVRGIAVTFADTTHTQEQRDVGVVEIRRAIDRLLQVGNDEFRDRPLFGGSDISGSPFVKLDGAVRYTGNDEVLNSFGDVNFLFATNSPGHSTFGAFSPEVEGSVDLKPLLTERTRIRDLHGGLGIQPGSIVVSDGFSASTVDLSSAETLRDVARLIETNPPAGRELRVRVDNNRLTVEIDQAGGGNLSIREVSQGTTASEFGLLNVTGTGTNLLVGQEIVPRLGPTTQLRDVLGSRAKAILTSDGSNNEIVIESRLRGTAANGLRVQYVDDSLLQAGAGLNAGSETVNYVQATDPPVAPRASLVLSGTDNDIVLTATTAGSAFNNVLIQLDASSNLGNAATASYNGGTKILTVGIDDTNETTVNELINAIQGTGLFTVAADGSGGEGFNGAGLVQSSDAGTVSGNTGNSGADPGTILINVAPGTSTANHVVAALTNDAAVAAEFTIELDGKDTSDLPNAGTGVVTPASTTTLAGGSGVEPDFASGIQIVNNGQTHLIDFSAAETVEDILNTLNGSSADVLAEINADATGINIRSRLSGVDFHIGENGGTTATELGIRSFTAATRLSTLNHGQGVPTTTGTDFTIQRRDGVNLDIDVSGATTIGDVLDRINNHVANTGNAVEARLAPVGNGIELVDANAAGTSTLTVTSAFGSSASIGLGLVAPGQTQATAVTVGTSETIAGTDTAPIETKGIFNSLYRLADSLENFDPGELERTVALLDEDFERLNFSRAEVGARAQSLDTLTARLADEEIELRNTLSLEIDTDLVKAISDLTQRQAAFQASLQLIGQISRLTVLDYV